MEDHFSFGKIVRFHRKKAGLTQIELAKLSGVGKTVVFDVENGKQTIQLNSLLKICKVLNITLDFKSPLMKMFLLESHEKS